MVDFAIKRIIQDHVPSQMLQSIKRLLSGSKLKKAEAALLSNCEGPDWLDVQDFRDMLSRYPVRYQRSNFNYQAPDLVQAKQVLQQADEDAVRFLEIGGGHGLTAWGLSSMGKDVTVLDVLDDVEPGARTSGVRAVVGDARQMPFDDNQFEVVYSYNSFEHIENAELAALEAWRVVKPGGTVYLNFAPIYNSSLGLHAFYEIGIPFLQHLWSEETLKPFVSTDDFWHLNYWNLAQYREMLVSVAPKLKLTHYEEGIDLKGIELIEQYPSCFRKRSTDIEEFIVSKLVMKFQAIKLSLLALLSLAPMDFLEDAAALSGLV